ncbi:MAG: 4-hydroxythreonine-4-phosphate dehydrogenase PdxA [Bacteroidota bacterium]
MSTTFVPNIGISIGDPDGIGPEVIIKTLASCDLNRSIPVVFSPASVLEYYTHQTGLTIPLKRADSLDELTPGAIYYYPADTKWTPGILDPHISGALAMESIIQATDAAIQNKTHALVTAPISKEVVNKAGFHIPGHTEFLADKTDADRVVMMLVSDALRVALQTVHIPLQDVARALSTSEVFANLEVIHESLIQDFGIKQPKIAMLGLNPHASDGGLMGIQEQSILEPALQQANQNGMHVFGPFAADGFFGQRSYTRYDAVLAMYHDQGLAPFKLLSFGNGVNFTAGLPVIRTSPDHGTAFDIAGTGTADPSSFTQAYQLAVELAISRAS